MEKRSILDFIGVEYQNALISVANLSKEFYFLQELDNIYDDIRKTFPVNPKNEVHFMVCMMFLQAHNEFYIGMSQLFRVHLGKAFISARIAIDAGFNAYYFTKNPKHVGDFLNTESPLQRKIFWRIKDHMQKNPSVYPLARDLIKTHEFTSKLSAHSSVLSMVYKYKVEKDSSNREEAQMGYFDDLKHGDFLAYYFAILKTFYMIFELFYNCFYKSELKIILPERDKKIATFNTELNKKHKQYPLSAKARPDEK